MNPILLLAKSFVRQNRWLLVALVGMPFLLGASLWSPNHAASRQDTAEIVQQEMFYGVAVVTFLASSAIHNEKRSRRIVGVLSKNVSRRQYLLAMLVGAACFAAAYFASVGVAMVGLLGRSGTVANAALALFVRGTVAALWTASIGLFLSTFLHPFLAAAFATVLALAPFALIRLNTFLTPVVMLLKSSGELVQTIPLAVLLSALAELAIMLLFAARIFRRRDVSVSIE